MRTLSRLIACVLITSCAGVVSEPEIDAGELAAFEPAPQQQQGRDAGAVVDAGASIDAGLIAVDAGIDIDAGMIVDAGTIIDAGMIIDAGILIDAGSPACPANATFCDSFETGLDSARWITNGDAQAFSIDSTTPAAHGQRSLHLAYGVPYGHSGTPTVEIRNPIAAPDDRIYLRTWLRFGNLGLPGAHPAFISVADAHGREQAFGSIINDFALLAWTPGGLDNARIWYEGGGSQWHPGVQNGDATPLTENNLNAGQWFCVELLFFGDHQSANDTQHPNEETKVWINGIEIPQLAATDALWRQELGHDPPEHWSPEYDGARWRLGVSSFAPASASLDLWFDSLAIGNTRLGCQ